MWNVRAHKHTHTHTQHVSKYTFQPGDIQETTRWVQGWCWDTSAYLDTRCTQHFLLHWTLCCAEVCARHKSTMPFLEGVLSRYLRIWLGERCDELSCVAYILTNITNRVLKPTNSLGKHVGVFSLHEGDKLAGKVQTTSCVLNGALMGTASEAFAGQLSQTSSRTQNLFHELAMCIFPCVLFTMCIFPCVLFIQITASHVLPSAIPQPGLEDVVLFSVPLDQPGLTQSHMGVLPMSQVDPIWKSEGPYTYVQRYGWTWCVLNFTICLIDLQVEGPKLKQT